MGDDEAGCCRKGADVEEAKNDKTEEKGLYRAVGSR